MANNEFSQPSGQPADGGQIKTIFDRPDIKQLFAQIQVLCSNQINCDMSQNPLGAKAQYLEGLKGDEDPNKVANQGNPGDQQRPPQRTANNNVQSLDTSQDSLYG